MLRRLAASRTCAPLRGAFEPSDIMMPVEAAPSTKPIQSDDLIAQPHHSELRQTPPNHSELRQTPPHHSELRQTPRRLAACIQGRSPGVNPTRRVSGCRRSGPGPRNSALDPRQVGHADRPSVHATFAGCWRQSCCVGEFFGACVGYIEIFVRMVQIV